MIFKGIKIQTIKLIKSILKTDDIKIALFADDTAIYTEYAHPQIAADKIQNHLDLLADCNTKWKIKINADNSNITIFKNR